jgi:hypothetical protein
MKPILLFVLTMFSGSSVMAQDADLIEVFGGYSFYNLRPTDSFYYPENSERVGLHGWHSDISLNFIGNIELAADLSGHYGKINGRNVNLHTWMIGYRFKLDGEKFNFYMHNLYGFSRISGEGNVLTPLIRVPSDTSFAFVPFGYGLEIKGNKKLTYRIIQFDLLIANWGSNSGRVHPRLSTGVVFNFGN